MKDFFSIFNTSKNNNNTISVFSPLGEPLRKKPLTSMPENRKSPFSIFPGDTHKLVLPPKMTSLDEVDFLLSINYVGEIEKAILTIVNKMYFVTSLQICQMLNIAGYDVEHRRVQTIIRKLINKSFLKRIEFFSSDNPESRSSFRAYTLGYHGMGVLRASGEKAKMQGYLSEQPTENIKKTLATNQLLVSVLREKEMSFESLLCLLEENNSREVIIRPRAVMQNEIDTYLIECVRCEHDWVEDLLERINRYQKVIDRFAYLNISLKKKPVLLILAESYEHMIQIQRLIPEPLDFDIIFSYDIALFDDVHSAFFTV